MKILMVCLGNICRSPLAEGILREKLPSSFLVDSAGTARYHVGAHPDKRSIAVAKKYGIDLSRLIGRQFSVNDFDEFDIIYVMDNHNYDEVTKLSRNDDDKNKVHLILDEVYKDQGYDVPDPYTSSENMAFENVFVMLDEACTEIARKLV